jgi:single-strand DNA-binding protein
MLMKENHMASFNKVIIVGNLGQDPELRYTNNQTPVVTLSVATTDVRTDREGNRNEQTEWHRVIVWNKQAENCAKYLAKGRTVCVEGRLQTRSWEDKTGAKRYTTEIVAQNIQFLGGGASRNDSMQQGDNTYSPAQTSEPASYGAPSLDDIPF